MSYPLPPHTFQQVFAAWDANQPAHNLLHYYDSKDPNYDFDGSFCYSFEVELGGWRYIVQAHVHVQAGVPNSSGNTFIPGFQAKKDRTPQWLVDLSPAYNATTYPHDWSSNPGYRTTLYTGAYRYPTKL